MSRRPKASGRVAKINRREDQNREVPLMSVLSFGCCALTDSNMTIYSLFSPV